MMSSYEGIYWRYHHVNVGVQVAYKYSLAVNQVSTPFLQEFSLTIKFCVTPYRMAKTANETKVLKNGTSKTW